MKRVILIMIMFSCVSSDRTREVLEDEGYSQIEITGYDAFACGRDDIYCTGFDAVGPSGHHVHGAVGCGMGCGKACTVRVHR